MEYDFYTADVFTQHLFGGNQLAVFPEARGLTPALMQQIAGEFNLSETVFVLPPDNAGHTRRLRIFTPGAELPFAGHPTVGAAVVLASIGAIPLQGEETRIIFEEGVGPVPVTIRTRDGRPEFARLSAAMAPQFGPPPPDAAALAAAIGVAADDILQGALSTPLHAGDARSYAYAPQAVSCGVPFLFIPLRDREALARARLNRERWEALLADSWAPHLYLITPDAERPGSHIRARMFAPAMNIVEDPATGAAASALGGYLGARCGSDGAQRWIVEQGFEMGRPSIIEVEADIAGGTVGAVRVGGAAVMVSSGRFHISDGLRG
jgi:trans-2,3-dihydro-3-hydroxyanthranilate isomerase